MYERPVLKHRFDGINLVRMFNFDADMPENL